MEKIKIGDKVHIGLKVKGGIGFDGTVLKIEGNKVIIQSLYDKNKKYGGQLKNTTKIVETKTMNFSKLKQIIREVVQELNEAEKILYKINYKDGNSDFAYLTQSERMKIPLGNVESIEGLKNREAKYEKTKKLSYNELKKKTKRN